MSKHNSSGLWTRDFTIITLGSVVSMVGGTLSGFAISIMVLDYTGSTFLYVLFNVCYQIPMLFCPLLAGPYLDRMSRKKVIYRLDFLSAGIYFLLFLLLRQSWFNYPLLLAGCVLLGGIEGVYSVAYESFYPNLISEGNFSKAYSIDSMLWPLAAMTTPIAALVYDKLGDLTPLFAFNALCFLIAACFERTIRFQETHMDASPVEKELGVWAQFRSDFKEGLSYIARERGLLAITLYFMVSNFTGSGCGNLYLPFFRTHPALYSMWPVAVITLYAIVSNFSVAGRFLGGLIHYKVKFPTSRKFAIAFTVYIAIELLEGSSLFLPIPLMALNFFVAGILGVTSYNIRIAATQSYVPDGIRARFNSVFMMLCSLGSITGSLSAGALAEVLPERGIIVGFSAICVIAAFVFMFRNRNAVSAIYNREV